ncbi:hypothetical protein D3C81_593020 [compost metagenome]
MRNLLQHPHLPADGVTDVAVAAVAWRVLSQFGQTGRGATEQLGAAPHRIEQIVATQEVFLTQFNPIVRARHIVVSGVVTALAVLLAQAHAPGIVLADHAIGVRIVEVGVQRVGLFHLVAGLSKSKAGKILIGGMRSNAGAHHGESQKQFFECSHWGDSSCAICFRVWRKVTDPALNSP